jgi:hypothetical protein
MSRAAIAWVVLVVPMWLVFVLGTHWEPIMRDGWYHWLWHRDVGMSLGHLADFAKDSYVHNNPRIGQLLTLMVYTPGPWHEIVTPLVELALFYLLTALVIGRWPSWRRTDDALVMATTTAIIFVAARSFGPMLFYRPFTGNYLYGLVLNLLWLVPYRLHAEEARRRSLVWAPVMLVLGVIAGLANEHTGPAFIAAAVVALIVYWRRGERFVPWAVFGLIGAIIGLLALIYAPGQAFRYNGLATQQTLLERVTERGVHGNLRILYLGVLYLKPSLLWIALALVGKLRKTGEGQPRARAIAEIVLVGTALLILVTLLASPKQGDRLYFAPLCLAAAGIAGWVVAQLGRIERVVAVGLAGVAIGYVGVRLISAYHTAGTEFSARMTAIEHAAPGSVVTVPPYSQKRSRYVLSDDFRAETSRGIVAVELGLAGIELSQRDETTPPADDDPDAP